MVSPEVYEYAFKRALTEMDSLCDMRPEDQNLKHARAVLLQARPTERLNSEPPKGADLAEDSKILKPIEPPAEVQHQIEQHLSAERVREREADRKPILRRSDAEGLDFRGRWKTEDGRTVTVLHTDEYGTSAGYLEGVEKSPMNWGPYGISHIPGLNLMERIREAASRK